jgi:hypothetical protein
MFVLFCACDVMNVLSGKKNENLQKMNKKKMTRTPLTITPQRR